VSTPVSVVVLNFNRCAELKATLSDILAQSHRPLEVIVADNASTDGSPEMVKKDFPSVKLLSMPENIGIRARRKAAEAATGDYVVMYDDDSGPSQPGDLSRIAAFFDAHPEASAVCTQVVRTRSGYSETHLWEKYAVGGDAENGYEGLFVHGSGTAYRRAHLMRTAAFDNELFWGDEEFDAALNFIAHGYRIFYVPSIVTNHRASLVNRNKGRFYRRVTRNHLLTFRRYFDTAHTIEYSLKEILYHTVLARGSFPHVWLGAWDALTWKGERKRQPIGAAFRPYLREVSERRYPGPLGWLRYQRALKENRKVKVF
jgi:GT2 family glycosyltransferase